jgi:hypothetical protein
MSHYEITKGRNLSKSYLVVLFCIVCSILSVIVIKLPLVSCCFQFAPNEHHRTLGWTSTLHTDRHTHNKRRNPLGLPPPGDLLLPPIRSPGVVSILNLVADLVDPNRTEVDILQRIR